MKNTLKTIGITSITALVLIGCGGGGSDSPTTPEVVESGLIVKKGDGTVLGTTHPTDAVDNGGVLIYDTDNNVVGFIQVDGSVNDVSGKSLGVCDGISEDTLHRGECTLPPTTSSDGTTNTTTSSDGTTNTTTSSDGGLANPDTDPNAVITSSGTLIGNPPGSPTVLVEASN